MSNGKDVALAAALVLNASSNANALTQMNVNSAATSHLASLNRLSTAQIEGRIVKDDIQRDKEKAAKRRERGLAERLADAEQEIAEMRVAMREWVASQRGLLALAKALREESETCPHQEHHKIGGKGAIAACVKIADDAADASLAIDEAKTVIKTEIPAFVPNHSRRKGKKNQ